MKENNIAPSALHEMPRNIEKVLTENSDLLKTWNSLTPLARNEWICWVTIPKKIETQEDHLKRLQEDLRKGKRRPCCWPGCPHRNPKAAKYFK